MCVCMCVVYVLRARILVVRSIPKNEINYIYIYIGRKQTTTTDRIYNKIVLLLL